MHFRILGLESSCDDTSAAIVETGPKILSNIVIGQEREHSIYKGVVPEIAARSHISNIENAIDQCFIEANLSLEHIDAIAATSGPGLIGGLIVGSMFGKALSSSLKKPFIAINHLEGHALTPCLTNNVSFPYLLLLISGGHCQFVAVEGLGKYRILGTSLDDAIGEAFDKVAKMIGLDFPGGALIEQRAKYGNPNRFIFPKPLCSQKNCNMSFSGLKTAVSVRINKLTHLSDECKNDIAASFQKTVCDILRQKSKYAIEKYNSYCNGKTMVVAGGVASNQEICLSLKKLANDKGYNFVSPPVKLCTDNAAMIAFAGLERLKIGRVNSLDFKPRARWSIDEVIQ